MLSDPKAQPEKHIKHFWSEPYTLYEGGDVIQPMMLRTCIFGDCKAVRYTWSQTLALAPATPKD